MSQEFPEKVPSPRRFLARWREFCPNYARACSGGNRPHASPVHTQWRGFRERHARALEVERVSRTTRAHARAVEGETVPDSAWICRERARCRRPITPNEVPGLQALGTEIRRLRWSLARAPRSRLAVRAQVSVRQLEQIEQAIRRTRHSTLARIAAALVELKPDLGTEGELVNRLAALAGAALAPESDYRERVDKRRRARWKRLYRRVEYRHIFPWIFAQLDAELRAERIEAKRAARTIARVGSPDRTG